MYEIIEKGSWLDNGVKVGNYTTIKSGAKIGKNTTIGDYCYIDSDVVIGENNVIETGVYIKGNVLIGNNNYIMDKTVIGLPSKHIGYHLYKGKVIIGNNNFIGNNCAIDCGNNYISKEHAELLPYLSHDLPKEYDVEDATIIGDRCYILNNVAIHHNCRIGFGNIKSSSHKYDTVICAGCCLNGFVILGKGAELASGTYVREFTALGEGCYTGMLSHVVKDVAPFCFIRANKNVGNRDERVAIFDVTNDTITKLRCDFERKRSGKREIY